MDVLPIPIALRHRDFSCVRRRNAPARRVPLRIYRLLCLSVCLLTLAGTPTAATFAVEDSHDKSLFQAVRRMVKLRPEIEEARVTLTSSGTSSAASQADRPAVTVSVKLRPGQVLSARTVVALQQSVARLIPHVHPESVTFIDVTRGTAISPSTTESAADNAVIERVEALAQQHAASIRAALGSLSRATVDVMVDQDLLTSALRKTANRSATEHEALPARTAFVEQVSYEKSRLSDLQDAPSTSGDAGSALAPTEIASLTARAARVKVVIPRDYYHAIVSRRRSRGETRSQRLDPARIEADVRDKVQRFVERQIPGISAEAISVSSGDVAAPTPFEAIWLGIRSLAARIWPDAGTWAVGVFAILAVGLLARSAFSPSSPQPPEETAIESPPRTSRPIPRRPKTPAPALLKPPSVSTASPDPVAAPEEPVRQFAFSFEDLLQLDDISLRRVVHATDRRPWALALKASPEPVRTRVFACLSSGTARELQGEMATLGPVRLSEVTSVRQQIADVIHALETAGSITVPGEHSSRNT